MATSIQTTDKNVLFVTSEVKTARAYVNRDLVSFHKQPYCCLNATVFEKCGIYPGMYARYMYNDTTRREITIAIRKDRPEWETSKWYKICEPKTNLYNRYCYIRTTNLLFDFNMMLLGCFEYDIKDDNPQVKFITIHY